MTTFAWPSSIAIDLIPLSEGFGELPLRQLTLDGCRQLSLPESFIRLQLSDENFMKCCKAVARLPESIVEHHLFKDAATLNLSRANLASLPERFGDLPSLVDLDLGSCHALAKNEETYAILSKISTLTTLRLAFCDMESLPEGSP